jgi:DNA-binding NtrC family response regulator
VTFEKRGLMVMHDKPAVSREIYLTQQPTIVAIEAGHSLRNLLRESLPFSAQIIELHTVTQALGLLHSESTDLVLLRSDPIGTWTALELAAEMRRDDLSLPIIFIAADSSEELAINAIKAGVTDYLKEPLRSDELTASINHALKQRGPQHGASFSEDVDLVSGDQMVGRSAAITAIKTQVANLAAADSNWWLNCFT